MMVRTFQGVLCGDTPIYMVCYKALCDISQFYLLFNSLRLLVYMQFAVRRWLIGIIVLMKKNRGEHGGVWRIRGSMGGGGMGEFLIVGSSMGEIWKECEMCWGVGGGKGRCGRCVGVWESMGGVESVLGCGKVWGVGVWKWVWGEVWKGWWGGQRVLGWEREGVGKCREKCGTIRGSGEVKGDGGATVWDPNSGKRLVSF